MERFILKVMLPILFVLTAVHATAQGMDPAILDRLEQLRKASDGGVSAQDIMESENRAKRKAEIFSQGLPLNAGDTGPTPVPGRFEHVIVRGGIPFPAPADVVHEPIPTPQPLPTPDMRRYEASTGYHDDTPYRPPRCENGSTQVSARVPNPSKKESTIVYYDTLYLPEDMVPLDSSEVFGQETHLVPYGPESGEGAYLHMKVHGVPCLPYRIRITRDFDYRDSGRNAYKNYDASPGDEGKFHSWVSKKLGDR